MHHRAVPPPAKTQEHANEQMIHYEPNSSHPFRLSLSGVISRKYSLMTTVHPC